MKHMCAIGSPGGAEEATLSLLSVAAGGALVGVKQQVDKVGRSWREFREESRRRIVQRTDY